MSVPRMSCEQEPAAYRSGKRVERRRVRLDLQITLDEEGGSEQSKEGTKSKKGLLRTKKDGEWLSWQPHEAEI